MKNFSKLLCLLWFKNKKSVQNKSTIIYLLILLFSAISLSVQADEPPVYVEPFEDFTAPADTVVHYEVFHLPSETVITTDTIIPGIGTFYYEPAVSRNVGFLPDPQRALWLGAIIPGFGQIVNRKYWKLPFVYGGFMIGGFAITHFNREFDFFRIAHRDLMINPHGYLPGHRSHLDFLESRNWTMTDVGGEVRFAERLITFRDNNRRRRDWSVLGTILFYGLVILDAYVDAHLYDFDITPDLSMRIEPAIINNDTFHRNPALNDFDFAQTRPFGSQNAIGIQWSFRLR